MLRQITTVAACTAVICALLALAISELWRGPSDYILDTPFPAPSVPATPIFASTRSVPPIQPTVLIPGLSPSPAPVIADAHLPLEPTSTPETNLQAEAPEASAAWSGCHPRIFSTSRRLPDTPESDSPAHAALDALNRKIEGPFEPRPLISDPWLEDIIRQRLGDDIEQYSIVVKRFRDGRGVSINEASVHNAASLFKLEVLYGVFFYRSAGLLDFDESLLISYEFAEYDLGTLPWAFGEVVPISQLVEAMITFSDNVSALVLYSRVGWSNLHSLLQAIGLQDSVIDEYNLTTSARDMAILLEAMACGEAIDPDSSSEMIEVLTRQELNSKIPALLPPDVKVAHKTGEWDDAAHDVGIVFAPSGEYLVAILSSHGWANDTIAEISALIYEYLESHP